MADREEDGVYVISCSHQTFNKGIPHFYVRETDVDFHKQLLRLGKYSHGEDRLPPVPSFFDGDDFAVADEFHGHIEIFIFFYRRKQCGFPSGRRDDLICMIDPQFTAGIDPVLTFPEFDQPCFAIIVKIDRLAVDDHIEKRRKFVIDGAISKPLLPGICRTCKYILSGIIAITKWFRQFIEHTAFFLIGHTAQLSYDLPFTEVEEDKEKKDK